MAKKTNYVQLQHDLEIDRKVKSSKYLKDYYEDWNKKDKVVKLFAKYNLWNRSFQNLSNEQIFDLVFLAHEVEKSGSINQYKQILILDRKLIVREFQQYTKRKDYTLTSLTTKLVKRGYKASYDVLRCIGECEKINKKLDLLDRWKYRIKNILR